MSAENGEMNMPYEMFEGRSAMSEQVARDLYENSFQEPEDMDMGEIIFDIATILTVDVENNTDGANEVALQGVDQIKELINKDKLPTNVSWYPTLLQKIASLEEFSKTLPRIDAE